MNEKDKAAAIIDLRDWACELERPCSPHALEPQRQERVYLLRRVADHLEHLDPERDEDRSTIDMLMREH